MQTKGLAVPKAQQMIRLPVFPGLVSKQVELGTGYKFGRPRGGKVSVINMKTGHTEAQLECICQRAGGGSCRLSVTGQAAICANDTCTNCTFSVHVPVGSFAGHLGDVFKT